MRAAGFFIYLGNQTTIMKALFCLLVSSLFILTLSSCKIETTNKVIVEKAISESQPKVNKKHIIECDTAFINNSRFIACQNNDLEIFILNGNNDTIYKNNEAPNKFEFIDFNEDGYQDMLLSYIGNYSSFDLALFDKDTNTLKNVEGFLNYPDAIRIKNTKYYYSYSRAGCGDSNWFSHLFYIENYKAYAIGSIQGIGCEHEEKNGIFIYKLKNEKEELIKSISRKPGYYEDKWKFIENYWNKNYHLFE